MIQIQGLWDTARLFLSEVNKLNGALTRINLKDYFRKAKETIVEESFDREKAEVLLNVLENEMPPLEKAWDGFATEEFLMDWYVHMSRFLGSAIEDPLDLALKSFPPKLKYHFFKPEKFDQREKALRQLLTCLYDAWGAKIQYQRDQTIRRIVVLYVTFCGNGHYTAALGIQQSLEKQGYSVHLLDGAKCCLYANTSLLRKRVAALKPDLIINTVSHEINWNQLSYDFNVPSFVVHTDYEVNKVLVEDDRRLFHCENSSLINYCVTHREMDRNRVSLWSSLPKERYQELIREIGFPVRDTFVRETDPDKIMALRKGMGFQGDERGILMIGNTKKDMDFMIDNISKLRNSHRSYAAPLYIIAVCGDDRDLRDKFQEALKTMSPHADIRIKVEGKLDAEQMAKYMKVISRIGTFPGVLVAKLGGSTTAEALEMGVYDIGINVMHAPGELSNADHLKHVGLGELYDKDRFVEQVSAAIKWKGDPATVYKPTLDWKVNLGQLVAQKFEEPSVIRS